MESVCDNTESPKKETEETPLSATMSKKQLRRQQRQEKWLSIKAEVRQVHSKNRLRYTISLNCSVYDQILLFTVLVLVHLNFISRSCCGFLFQLTLCPTSELQNKKEWIFRAKEKQRKKQKRREALERGDIMAPTRKKLRSNTMAKSSCQTSVVIDCSLDSYMGEKVRLTSHNLLLKLSLKLHYSMIKTS